MKCINCGEELKEDELYCENCGTENAVSEENVKLKNKLKNIELKEILVCNEEKFFITTSDNMCVFLRLNRDGQNMVQELSGREEIKHKLNELIIDEVAGFDGVDGDIENDVDLYNTYFDYAYYITFVYNVLQKKDVYEVICDYIDIKRKQYYKNKKLIIEKSFSDLELLFDAFDRLGYFDESQVEHLINNDNYDEKIEFIKKMIIIGFIVICIISIIVSLY